MKVIKIKKAGYIYIFLTIFLGFASINTGNNLLYLITSFLLAIMGISGFFGKINISGLDVHIEFPDDIFANNTFYIKAKLINKKKYIPSFLINLKFLDKKIFFPYIERNKSTTKLIEMKIANRGFFKINLFEISSQFPFGFFERYLHIKKEFLLVVYPEPKFFPLSYFSNINNQESYFTEEFLKSKKGEDFISLRDYTPGDSFKEIHWKMSAKTGELKVKSYASYSKEFYFIEFDKINIKDVEQKISAITYLTINKRIVLKIENKVLKNKKEILYNLAIF